MSLTPEQNELLTRVEGGAAMGRYLRSTCWFPAVISSALKPGDAPYPVRLLGEDFVAFRAPDGRVGFFAEHCPHRGASLLLARNEGDGLRCIFHGWKFSVDGRTVEVPTQTRAHDEFCKRVPLQHHPTREAAGVVWVWLGESPPAPFFSFEFLDLTEPNVCPARSILDFNWLQALEGLVDSAHVSILHQDWLSKIPANPKLANAVHDTAPVYEFEERPDGFRYAALRNVPDGGKYVRITEYISPWFSFTPGDQGSCFFCVPVDDFHTAFWSIRFDRNRAILDSPWKPKGDPMNWPPAIPGREQRWGQDRAAMAAGSFSGFTRHFFHEDVSVAASQGRIASRRKEFLNSGDAAVVRLRKWLLHELAEFQSGKTRSAPTDVRRITAGHGVIGPQDDWREQVFR